MPAGQESNIHEELAMACDRCGASELETAYRSPSGRRGLRVAVCGQCGLVQSLPRLDRRQDHSANVTSDAGWGNIRYGKALRTSASVSFLDGVMNLGEVATCLDLGASRGDFVEALKQRAPMAEVLAVEPDAGLEKTYEDLAGVSVRVERIENLRLPPQHFDLIYCSHTLEHVISPSRVLRQLADALAPTGRIFIEVPNLDFITIEDVIEEWFIDKHLYHFSPGALTAMVQEAGLTIEKDHLHFDETYITLVAQIDTKTPEVGYGHRPFDANAAVDARRIIAAYENRLNHNIKGLAGVADTIGDMIRNGKRVAVWGGGRILDSLVRHGGLDPTQLIAIVDTFLVDIVQEVHGCPLQRPESLGGLDPDVVIVASREYFDEIAKQAQRLNPSAKILGYHQLSDHDPGA